MTFDGHAFQTGFRFPLGSKQEPAAGAPTPEELKAAFKAFKKRLKITRLNEESKLSRSPLSKGASGIVAVTPPSQFSHAVWEELARQGKLKKMLGGTYGLATE